MLKRFIIFISLMMIIFDDGESIKFNGLLKSYKQQNGHNRKLKLNVTCNFDYDCKPGFYCKNNDCLAKKADGSLCLTGRNEECECGKCVLDKIQYIKICQSRLCPNYGITEYNSCNSNNDCPDTYFCDVRNSNICRSKVGNDRLCFDDDMCSCGKCLPVSQNPKSKNNKQLVSYNVCSC